jgi:hypothetical protein
MKKTYTVDAETLAGNPWVQRFVDQNNSVSFTADAADTQNFTMDQDGIGFYISQLAHLETTIYQRKYAQITYLQDIPVVAGIPEHAQNWTYRSYDGVTLGRFIGASAKDLPKISAKANKSEVPIGYSGNMLEWSLEEMRSSAFLNMPIDTIQASLALRSSQEHSQRVAYFGDAERNMHGFFNHPNVTLKSASKPLNEMSGQEMFDAVNDLIFEVAEDSALIHLPDTVLLYPEFFKAMNSTLMTGYTDTSVMKFFKDNNYYTMQTGKQISILPRLQLKAAELTKEGVQNNGKDRIMVYEKNAENLGVVNNLPFRLTAPQPHLLSIEVAGEYKCSGTEFRFPLSAKYQDAA